MRIDVVFRLSHVVETRVVHDRRRVAHLFDPFRVADLRDGVERARLEVVRKTDGVADLVRHLVLQQRAIDLVGQRQAVGVKYPYLAAHPEFNWQKGVLTLTPTASRFNLEMPLYASVAGFDLVATGSKVPTAKLTGDPLAGKFDLKTENFEQLSNISRMTITDLLLALPSVLSYLESVSAESLSLSVTVPGFGFGPLAPKRERHSNS